MARITNSDRGGKYVLNRNKKSIAIALLIPVGMKLKG